MKAESRAQLAKLAAIFGLLVGLAACGGQAQGEFSAEDAGLQAVALGALSMQNSDAYIDFAKEHGSDTNRILQERFAALQPALDQEAMAAYEEVFSKEEMEYLGRMYGTRQGQEILRKYSQLYPRLSVIGERYAAKAIPRSSP